MFHAYDAYDEEDEREEDDLDGRRRGPASILLNALSIIFFSISILESDIDFIALRIAAARMSLECKNASCFEIYLIM